MADDKKEAPKPKDLSNLSTDELMKDFAETTAELDTKLIKQAFKELKETPPSDEKLKEEEKEKAEKTLKRLGEQREGAIKKFGKDEGEKKFRGGLETIYRKMETIKNDPEAYRKRLEEVKKQLQEPPKKDLAYVSADRFSPTMNIDLGRDLLAYARATEIAQADFLWKDDVSDILKFPTSPRSKSKGHEA